MTQSNSRIKVFIVDDDKNILRLYSLLCKLNGLKVVGKANNGIEAVEKLTNSNMKPDVILMDYHMPIINGIEASKLILNLNKSFKILMVSADASIREEALSNGIIDFYEKSHNFKSLCQKIKKAYNLPK
ncbi:MAG: response regulator [Promethearchaeota archaeon]